jgi:hypothetical protein
MLLGGVAVVGASLVFDGVNIAYNYLKGSSDQAYAAKYKAWVERCRD